jgi:hypothetical protein
MAEMQGALFQWRAEDEYRASYGEGVSRPHHKARVRDYRVRVVPPQAQPFLWFTKAENKTAVIRYARNRWPDSAVEVL